MHHSLSFLKRVMWLVLALGACYLSARAAEQTGATNAPETIKMGAPFADNAILQCDMPVPVWGWSKPGTQVTVLFDKQTKNTVADKEGTWRVTLDPLSADKLVSVNAAPTGRTLTIVIEQAGEKTTRVLNNILMGEVWLCSGQSNMAGPLRMNPYPPGTIEQANYPALRKQAGEEWMLSTPQTAGGFSRVAFCFGRKLQEELKVPVGLLIAATSGSPIESWMRILPEGLPVPPTPKKGEPTPHRPVNYETQIAPRVGYGMRGTIWYQGEANSKEGREYFVKLQSMITDWRNAWGQGDFPFYLVQLASIDTSPTNNPAGGDGRARIRNAQLEALTLKNTGMSVAIDIGALKEHPRNKYDTALRLARWALNKTYGRKDIVPSGPLYKSHAIEGEAIRITFDHAQNGLMLARKEGYEPPVPTPGAKIPWLSIQAKDNIWHWADGKLDGADLIVSCKEVKDPIAVRYAYTQKPEGCNIYNKDGLPASPFSTNGY